MGIRLCLGWETGELEELRFNRPFMLRGKKALLLGIVRAPEEGKRLWFLCEERGQKCPEILPFKGTMRAAALSRYMVSYESMIASILLRGQELYRRCGEAGTVFECTGIKQDLLEYLMHRGKVFGGFSETSPYGVKIGMYAVDQDLDFGALADAEELPFTLVFEGSRMYPKYMFVNKAFVMPLGQGEKCGVRVGYDDPLSGDSAGVDVRRVKAFDVGGIGELRGIVEYLGLEPGGNDAKKVVAGIVAAAADGDRLLFAEYDCGAGRSVSLYLEDFLRRPKIGAAGVVFDVNDLLEKRGGGKTCMGFCAGAPDGDGGVVLLHCNYDVPEETVHVAARGTVTPDPDVERFRNAEDVGTARKIMDDLRRFREET